LFFATDETTPKHLMRISARRQDKRINAFGPNALQNISSVGVLS
jgi:hypothetical protein